MSEDRVSVSDIGWGREVRTVAAGVHHLSAFSAMTAFETDEGLVLVDTGLEETAPWLASQLRERTDQPVHTVVYTHGHVDHVHGTGAFLLDEQQPPRVVAHENMPARFDRYERTRGHNDAINARQFGGTVEAELTEGESNFRWPDHPPDLLYGDELTLSVGELTFELHHGRGETDDHTWVYCPEREVLCSGDFFVSMSPNAGNPQKVQRYPWAWAEALERMAGVDATVLCPGHGQPIEGEAAVREALLTSADYLHALVEATLAALNDGSPPHVDVVHAVEFPDHDAPYLREQYDESEFVVRNVLRYFGGWWSGRPSELKPAERSALATEIATLAGGPVPLADRALDLFDAGHHRLAPHLADYALEAAPDDPAVQDRVATLYERRAEAAESLMAANLYRSAAAYAGAGRPFT